MLPCSVVCLALGEPRSTLVRWEELGLFSPDEKGHTGPLCGDSFSYSTCRRLAMLSAWKHVGASSEFLRQVAADMIDADEARSKKILNLPPYTSEQIVAQVERYTAKLPFRWPGLETVLLAYFARISALQQLCVIEREVSAKYTYQYEFPGSASAPPVKLPPPAKRAKEMADILQSRLQRRAQA